MLMITIQLTHILVIFEKKLSMDVIGTRGVG